MKFFIFLALSPLLCFALPDIRTVKQDLTVPPVTEGKPAAGKRVMMQLNKYKGTKVHHLLYLPVNFDAGKKYNVIVEYAGNGPYKNKYGDVSTGKVDGCGMGYGLSGGKDFIWLVLPYVSKDRKENQCQWWGDVNATVEYCKAAVKDIKDKYKTGKFILTGFSRGSIACNYIGLADDKIAVIWSGFVCYSHYDGVRKWSYQGSDKKSAALRLKKLGKRPQFIIMENGGNRETKSYLNNACPNGNFTFVDLPYRNHNSSWLLRPTAERKKAREWLKQVLIQ